MNSFMPADLLIVTFQDTFFLVTLRVQEMETASRGQERGLSSSLMRRGKLLAARPVNSSVEKIRLLNIQCVLDKND